MLKLIFVISLKIFQWKKKKSRVKLAVIWATTWLALAAVSANRGGGQTYRLQLALLEDPGEDEAAQRHGHDEDEGEGQRRHGGLHHP